MHGKAFSPSWKSFYRSVINDENFDVKVIYCPVKTPKEGYSGQYDDTETWLNEIGVKYVHINNFSFTKDKPDILVFQTPYETHRVRKHNPKMFYKRGIKMMYISYGLEFTENTNNIRNHFQRPIHKYSWRIYTFCKDLIKDYKKYCPKGDKHVRCVGHPKFDALYDAKNIQIPDELKKKINGKKVICWHPHFPCDYSDCDGKKVLSTFPWDENLKMLEYIKNDKDNFYIFMPHHMFFGAFEFGYCIPHKEIEYFKNQLENGDNSTIWYGEYPEVLTWCDAFLGERSAVTMEMLTTGKPVCYLENHPEVYNEFGKAAINSFYYAKNATEAIAFIESFKNNKPDIKAQARKAVFDKYIEPYWDGKCGERIKEDILKSRNELKTNPIKRIFDYINSLWLDFWYSDLRKFIFSIEKKYIYKQITFIGIKLKFKTIKFLMSQHLDDAREIKELKRRIEILTERLANK